MQCYGDRLCAGWCRSVTLHVLVLRYAAFAVVATVANLAVQRMVLSLGESAVHFAAAVAAGTLAGLVIKYVLDKRWIFYDLGAGLAGESRKFSLYTLRGVVTTAIFWGTETLFWLVWGTQAMRETGAVIGLAIGYVVKYRLDRRFVFTDNRLEAGE